MFRYEWHWMVATVEAQTDKAVLLSTEDNEQWVPYAMIKAITDDIIVGETQRLAIPMSMAREKGFNTPTQLEHNGTDLDRGMYSEREH